MPMPIPPMPPIGPMPMAGKRRRRGKEKQRPIDVEGLVCSVSLVAICIEKDQIKEKRPENCLIEVLNTLHELKVNYIQMRSLVRHRSETVPCHQTSNDT
jgi:hypothetical protein